MPMDPQVMREKAFCICRDYLHGAWRQIQTPDDMTFRRISGGMSNFLYYCGLPTKLPPEGAEPSQVLVRIYGQVHGEESLEQVITESVIFTLLSERNLGPRLYGVFPGGRLEEYIPAQCLKTEDLWIPHISRQIAHKVAKVHSLRIPVSKEPTWLWNTMNRWLNTMQKTLPRVEEDYQLKKPRLLNPFYNFTRRKTNNKSLPKEDDDSLKPEHKSAIKTLKNANLTDEVKWLRNLVSKTNWPVRFCHNDLQEGNFLALSKDNVNECDLSLIDFEYCAYNYRGFDLANHFCEWTFDYSPPDYPYYVHRSTAASREQKLQFLREYQTTYRNETEDTSHKMDTSGANESQIDNLSDEEDLELMLEEIRTFTLASHLFWTLWSVVNAPVTEIPFGYWEYALTRLNLYLQLKQEFEPRRGTKRSQNGGSGD